MKGVKDRRSDAGGGMIGGKGFAQGSRVEERRALVKRKERKQGESAKEKEDSKDGGGAAYCPFSGDRSPHKQRKILRERDLIKREGGREGKSGRKEKTVK